jgi:hypothetical protein
MCAPIIKPAAWMVVVLSFGSAAANFSTGFGL